MMIRDGVVSGKVKISEMIAELQGHIDLFGDHEIRFHSNGKGKTIAEFEHYDNLLILNISEKAEPKRVGVKGGGIHVR